MSQTGVCKYCGQTKITTEPTQEERDYIVTYHCDCPSGFNFRQEERTKEKIEAANREIDIIFGQEIPNFHIEPIQNKRFVELMKMLAEAAIRNQIRNASIEDEHTGAKGKISVNAKGVVSIERGHALKYKREL